jgi:hypothetical protein
MQLLYCVHGAVVAWHDSAQQVAGSAYGDGVRVIPYDQDIRTLPKFGPPPDSGPDTRPFAQPAETPQILIGFASQQRWETSTGGLVFNNIPVNTDRVSQTLISALAQYAAGVNPNTPISFTQDGAAYPITAKDAIAMNNQITAAIQNGRAIEAQCIVDLTSATPTLLTYEDVEAKFATLRKK